MDPELLTNIYERVRACEFQPSADHVLQVVKVEQMILGKKPVSTQIPVYYLRQVNEVNSGDNAFVQCVSVCVFVCAAAGQWELNANISKTVKATDFKFDTSLHRDSPDMTPKNFSKRGRGVVT